MAKNKKHINDKFYTKTEIVNKVLENLDLTKFDLIIEPSAGDGKFYDVIKSLNVNVLGLDIEPEHPDVIKQDWFTFQLDKEYKNILAVGNPPFGNQSSLAFAFIRKCDELKINTIAFILPKSFKKESVQHKIPPYYHLIKEMDLNDNSFLLDNKDYKVPSIFQIWERKSEKRNMTKKDITTEYFTFVKKNESPDISFRRVGFYAGSISDDTESKAEVSHYFIKSNIDIDKLKSILNSLKWKHDNTAGPRSIGKRELIQKIKEKFNI